MAMVRFRFASPPTGEVWRAALRREVGWRRSTAWAVEWELAQDGEGWVLTLLTQDGIALVYAGKVSLALGGTHVPFTDREWTVPEWAATPWTGMGWWTRWRISIGPTRL